MQKVRFILEVPHIEEYLRSRGIYARYIKAKKLLLGGDTRSVLFKKLEPKSKNRWSFRITKKYRAQGHFKDAYTFAVVDIDDHQ